MSNIIRWGHFSDLHFRYNDNFQTKVLREKLLKKICEDNINFDFIVITGDIANKGIFAEDTFIFINEILEKTNCNKKNLFICCGNHDIGRNDFRSDLIIKANSCKEKDAHYSIDDYGLKLLFNVGHEKFINTFKKLTDRSYSENAHFLEEREHYNIYNINTCILSGLGQGSEEGKLLVCDNHLFQLSKNNVNNSNKLNIAIGHHGIDCIHKGDQNQLITLFDSMNIDIYLCGHNHEIGFQKWDSSENGISQFMCGGIFKDNYNSPSFMTTEYNLETHSCATTIYFYSTNNNSWNIMSDARYPFKNGIYYFTPKRLQPTPPYINKELAVSYSSTFGAKRLFNNKDIRNVNINDTYSNIISLQTFISNNIMTKIENKKNIFQNNSAYIYSTIAGIEEKHLILCDRIYNKFYENIKYRYLKYLKLLFPNNNLFSEKLEKIMLYNIINDWYKLICELLDNFSLETVNVSNSIFDKPDKPIDIIIQPIIDNYNALFELASKFILGCNIADKNILNHLSLTKKIILDENNYFFGFEDQLNYLINIVLQKESNYYCIAADEGYGKTSLLSKLIGYMIENNSYLSSSKIANILPWLPNVIVVFGKQCSDVNIAIRMIVEQANLLLVNPISYENNTSQDLNTIVYTTFEALSKELGSIVIVIDAVDEFNANDLAFLPESLPQGITVFVSARKFARNYNDGKRNIFNIKHSGFTYKDEKAITDFYGLSFNEKGVEKFIKDVLKRTNGWPLIVCDIKKQLEKFHKDFSKVKIESSLNSVFSRKKNMWKENGSTDCCRWKLLELFSVFACASYLSRNNIHSYLLTNLDYSYIHSEEIDRILDCVSDQLISDDGGLYKLKYASFAEYITDNKTGFTTIELRRIISNIVCWIINSIDDNIEIIAPFYLAWRNNIDVQIKNSVEQIIDLLINKNKNEILIQIAGLLISKNKLDYTIEKCLTFALKQDENAKLLYASYLYNIIKTDDSKRKAIDFYKELCENGNLKALLIYASMLSVGTKYVKTDEEKALKLLDKIQDDTTNNVIGIKYNIFSNKNSKFYNIDKAITFLHKLADKNDIAGMAILGSRLIRGDRVKRDPIEGEKWLRKAAVAGYNQAMAELGSRLINGDGLGQDYIEGEKWLRKAAVAGYNQAMGMLGSKLIDGDKLRQDCVEGEKWLRKAAELGCNQAMAELGSRLIDGDGVGQDNIEGENWLRKAAMAGYNQAMAVLGSKLIDGDKLGQDCVEGEKWLRKAAEAGYNQAMVELGSRLIDGDGVSQDNIEGENWLRKAAEAGYNQAMAVLGSRLIDGDGVDQDNIEGEKWLRKAAGIGYNQAMAVLGSRLIDGNGINQDNIEGEKYLRKAAELGCNQAMAVLGSRLIDGDGVNQDNIEGENWLRKAAEAGYNQAMAVLGSRLIDGDGINQDNIEGEKWLRKAAGIGYNQAIAELGTRLIDGDGVSQDNIEGENWLRKAAKAGYNQAMAVLGSRLIDGDRMRQDIPEGIKLCIASIDKGNADAANTLGFYFYKSGNFIQSVNFFKKGMLLGNYLSKINLSYMIRKGEYPNYSGTPNIEELLGDLVKINRYTFALINYSLYLISNLNTTIDWIEADYCISLIDYDNTSDIDSAVNWWQNLSNQGDLEGDLVLGWLCLRKKVSDPEELSVKERFAKAKQIYNIPEWLIECAN